MIDIQILLVIACCLMFGIIMFILSKHESNINELKKDAVDSIHFLPLFQTIIQTEKDLLELSRCYRDMLEEIDKKKVRK